MSSVNLANVGAPPTPPVGTTELFVDTDKKVKQKDDTGAVTDLTATNIAADSVDNTKLANMPTQTIKGRTTVGIGDPEDLTAAQATAILNPMVGDSGAGGTKGLVPAPAAGDAAAGKFLKADGTFQMPASGAGFTYETESLERDEFLNNSDTDELGSQGWRITNNGVGTPPVNINGEVGHPGLLRLPSGNASGSRSAIHQGDTSWFPVLGVGGLTFITGLRVSAISQYSRLVAGLGDLLTSVADQNNGVYFSFDLIAGDTNWHLVAANGGTRTRVDTGIAVVANTFYSLKFVANSAGTSIQAFINGVLVGSAITTNIPTAALLWLYKIDGVAGGATANLDVDYWFYRQTGFNR